MGGQALTLSLTLPVALSLTLSLTLFLSLALKALGAKWLAMSSEEKLSFYLLVEPEKSANFPVDTGVCPSNRQDSDEDDKGDKDGKDDKDDKDAKDDKDDKDDIGMDLDAAGVDISLEVCVRGHEA